MYLFCERVKFILCPNCKKCEASAARASCWSCAPALHFSAAAGASVVRRANPRDGGAANRI